MKAQFSPATLLLARIAMPVRVGQEVDVRDVAGRWQITNVQRRRGSAIAKCTLRQVRGVRR